MWRKRTGILGEFAARCSRVSGPEEAGACRPLPLPISLFLPYLPPMTIFLFYPP